VGRDELKKYKEVLIQQLHLGLVDALVPEELRAGACVGANVLSWRVTHSLHSSTLRQRRYSVGGTSTSCWEWWPPTCRRSLRLFNAMARYELRVSSIRTCKRVMH
jgi:hypothetical protein